MAIPIIFGGIAAVTGVVGAAKGVKGALDTKEANEVQQRAERRLKIAQSKVEKSKAETNKAIQSLGEEKLHVCANQVNEFVDVYSKIKNVQLTDSLGIDELKKLNITDGNVREMKETALSAIGVLGSGVTGIGAGVLLGWGTYGGVMALGTASTGAAIGGLSGVAATNATLAWLGGGALAAGGGGMALGTVVLGGIIAGPALLVAGGLFGSKAKEKLNNAYSNLAEVRKIEAEIDTACAELKVVADVSMQINGLLKKLGEVSMKANYQMKQVVLNGTDWKKYTDDEKKTVVVAMKAVQAVKAVVDTPLLTEDGVITKEVNLILNNQDYKKLIG